jgi:hypothetical protein
MKSRRLLTSVLFGLCMLLAAVVTQRPSGSSEQTLLERFQSLFRKKSHANACINNLRQIDAAKQTWGLEFNKQPNDTPTWEDLRTYLSRGNGSYPWLICEQGGSYTINCLSNFPQCSVKKHVLPSGVQ